MPGDVPKWYKVQCTDKKTGWVVARSVQDELKTVSPDKLLSINMLTKNQIEEILAKKPESRYKYFVRTVVAEEEVWGLADEEGWLLLEDKDDTDVLAVFPNPQICRSISRKRRL